MDAKLSSHLNLMVFTTGRRLFALQQMLQIAEERKLDALAEHVKDAIAHDEGTRKLDFQWEAAKSHTQDNRLRSIDQSLDQAIVALRDVAQAHRATLDGDEPLAGQIDAMLTAIFPAGVKAIISAPYIDQLSAVREILEALDGPHKLLIRQLGLERVVAKITRLTADYAAHLKPKHSMDFEVVRQARRRGQDNLLTAMAMIIGRYPKSSESHERQRGALLMPLLEQNEAIRKYRRARRRVQDVDPVTGAVDTNAPASQEGSDDHSPVDRSPADSGVSISMTPLPPMVRPAEA